MRTPILFLAALVAVPRAAGAQGDPLGPEFRVNTYTTSNQETPNIAADGSGNFVVVWNGYGPDDQLDGVFGQRYASSGEPLGPEFRVNTYTTNSQFFPSVAADSTGDFVVVWTSQFLPDDGEGIFAQRYASSGAPLGPEFRVNSFTTHNQRRPSVALDSSGSFVVVWESYGQEYFPIPNLSRGIFGQRYAGTGAPLGPEFRVNTYTQGDQETPTVAADASGNFVVVWQRTTPQDGVFAQRFAASGTPAGPEFRVNTYTAGAPSVATDSSGNFVVAWVSSGIFGQRFASSGAPLGPQFQINTYPPSSQECAVASDASGNFVVVWTGPGSDLWEVFGRRYASSGEPLGPEFRVNTYTTGAQGFDGPTVASDASGKFVVVWSSVLQVDGTDVFGQRYSQMVPVELMHFRVE